MADTGKGRGKGGSSGAKRGGGGGGKGKGRGKEANQQAAEGPEIPKGDPKPEEPKAEEVQTEPGKVKDPNAEPKDAEAQRKDGPTEPTQEESKPEQQAGLAEGDNADKPEVQEEPVAKETSDSKAEDPKEELKEEQTQEGGGKTLRDDEDCFIADYTDNKGNYVKPPKFVAFEAVKRVKISRDLVESDPEVSLRVRKEPNFEAEEIMAIGAEDTVEIVGQCGVWYRLAGDEDRWILSKKGDLVLLDVLVSGWGLSALSSGWGFGFSGSAADKAEEVEAPDAEKPASSSGGWGFGGFGLSGNLSGATSMLSGVASSVSASILAAGAPDAEGTEGTGDQKGGETQPEKSAGGKGVDVSSDDGAHEGEAKDLTETITSTVDTHFNKEIEMDQGGLAPVRFVSQGISVMENAMGWLSTTAKEKAKVVQETITSEELMETAWSGVKGGVKASTQVASQATEYVSKTTSELAQSQTVTHVSKFGRATLVTVGNTVINAAGTVLSQAKSVEDMFPNRSLGGVLAIEISGVIILRDPNVDEDDDQFLTDQYDKTPMVPDAIEAVSLLAQGRFQEKIYLISVASPGVQAKMLRWLTNRGFYEKSGIPRENVHFCRELDEKKDVCKELGITHMIESSVAAQGMVESMGDNEVLLFGDGSDIIEAENQDDAGQQNAITWWHQVMDKLLPIRATEEAVEAAVAEANQVAEEQAEAAESSEVKAQ